jgi:hypothetical protein
MPLLGVIPILRIFDVARAKEHYLDFLGFTLDWEHRFEPDTPLYFQITKESCTLHLSEHHGDGTPGTLVRVETANLAEYCAVLSAKGYKYWRPGIQRMPWGTDDMTIGDPFGNKLIFWEKPPKS